MSFSFRNIFSPDDSEFEGSPESGAPNGFSAPAGAQPGRGNLLPEAAAETRGQSFLVSELLPLVPTAIVAASGIPMEKEIRVPVPDDGSLDVKLSTLYHLCPELFAAEITPLNDSVITLPPRVGVTQAKASGNEALAASSIFSKPEASAGGGAFWSPVTPTVGGSAAANPFSGESAPPQNAFSAPGDPASPAAAAKEKVAGGFDAPAASFGSNAFSAPPAESPVQSPAGVTDAGFFGFSNPPTAKSEGEPAASGNPFESDKGFATLFSKQAEKDAAIPHPSGPFGGPSKPAESEGVWGAMFRGEVKDEPVEAVPDFESIGNLLSQAKQSTEPPVFVAPPAASAPAAEPFAAGFGMMPPKAAPDAEAAPPAKQPAPEIAWSFDQTPPPAKIAPTPSSTMNPAAPVFQAPEAFAPPAAPKEAETVPTVPKAEGPASVGFAQGFGAAFAEATPDPADAPEAVSTPPAAAVEAVFAAAAAPVSEAPEKVDAAPAKEEPVAAAPAPAQNQESAPIAAAPAPSSEEDDLRDLEMRAIFSTSERFNLSMVARKVVALPGINSCSLSTPAKMVHASRRDETRLGNEAREMISTLRSLAKLTGLPEARTFTLQTDRGIVSLFLEGDFCVTVNQETATFQPGVREKLILIARSIGKLRD
jgi:hypothetical protein